MATLRATEFFNNTKLKLIVIESVELVPDNTSQVYHCSGLLEPLAIIVCCADGSYALDMEAGPTTIERFKQDIPELNAMLASFGDATRG